MGTGISTITTKHSTEELFTPAIVDVIKELRPELNEHSTTDLANTLSQDMIAARFGHKIIPGTVFPDVSVPSLNGGTLSLQAENGRSKLVVFYRGTFCPFCMVCIFNIVTRFQTNYNY